MKIISGQYRGRILETTKDNATRPPLEFLRSALFNILGKDLVDKKILDIFAGSGSLGLEALSRGASHCTFIDSGRAILKKLEQNIKTLACGDRATVEQGRVPGVFSILKKNEYDFIFVDPPFDLLMRGEFLEIEDQLLPYLSANGLIIIRHPENVPYMEDKGLYEMVKEKKYGISVLKFKKPIR